MFEQESYDKAATVQVESQPQPPLFRSYEIKSWEFSPVIYKILAASVVLHVAVIVFIAQTNILTMRGCDSPWVGSVCQVVDMAYVGAMVFGTDREFVDEAYENIDLGEAEITFIDVTNDAPPLSYPEGYFQIANPEQHQMRLQMAQNPDGSLSAYQPGSVYTPPPTSGSTPSLFDVQPNPPAANPNAFKDDSSNGLFKVESASPNQGVRTARNQRNRPIRPNTNANTNTAKPDDEAVAENNTNTEPAQPKADPTNPITGPDINKRPIVDLGNFVNEKLQGNEIDLQTEFTVNAKGKLDENGRLKSFQWGEVSSADPDMLVVVKRAIEAINVAGYLQYLKEMSGKDLNFKIQQDTENLSALLVSEMESETRARSIKSALDLYIGVVKSRKQGENADQNDKDDLALLENTKVETNGKQVVLKFVVPTNVAHPMIKRKLAEQAAANQKPNGINSTTTGNNTAVK